MDMIKWNPTPTAYTLDGRHMQVYDCEQGYLREDQTKDGVTATTFYCLHNMEFKAFSNEQDLIDFKAGKEKAPCSGNCGMNYCDDNGCTERKRVYIDPIPDQNPLQGAGGRKEEAE